MIFNSLVFVVFGIIFYSFWPLCKKNNLLRWTYLTFASFVFYGWWDWRYLSLLVISGLIDFWAGLAIFKYPQAKKPFLIVSLSGNLFILGLFKYGKFITDNFNLLLAHLSIPFKLPSTLPVFFYTLPIGISFYTFQSMSYTIDVYRGKMKPTKHVLHFFSFLALFPQLVAGPIIRASDLLPDLEKVPSTTERVRFEGTKLIILGFFKKMVIADNLAYFVDSAFANVRASGSSIYWLVILLSFAIQIYCDFSGYSDIARGLGRWLGYDFMVNFNLPYFSRSLREFWSRWHISLTTWLRDYIYFPLGGNKCSRVRSHINMWVTMLLSGLWHGAAWHFVFWSGLHASYLSIERIAQPIQKLLKYRWGRILLWTTTMFQVLLSWAFFRAQNLADSMYILKSVFSFDNPFPLDRKLIAALGYITVAVAADAAILLRFNPGFALEGVARERVEIIWWALIAGLCIFMRGPTKQFIYFQF